MAERDYRRLTRARSGRRPAGGVGSSLGRRASLWLGTDHLLQIDSTGYTESYKRFYFRDIQAITIHPNNRRRTWNIVLSALLLAWLGFGPLLGVGSIAWLVLSLPLAVPLAINNLFGATCTCYLRTAVQTEDLPSLGRVRRAKKILAHIRPFVVAAQGELTREEIVLGVEQLGQPQAAAVGAAPPVLPTEPGATIGDVPTP